MSRELADKLTADHLRFHPASERIGTEIALIDQLSEAVGSSTGRGSARGVSGSRSPIDLGAMSLYSSIESHVSAGLASMRTTATGPLSARARVYLYALGSEDYDELTPVFMLWEERIRALLDPPVQVGLRGISCAVCEYDKVLLPDPAERGAELMCPAILVTVHPSPSAECRVCGKEYDTIELHSLRNMLESSVRG